ncbi:hypothetical protein MYX82_03610 [Acidobacteria bacterium AH-259-D05]|nr:hypothetical protein [Acidobacteria bacterium AH-259-D05]
MVDGHPVRLFHFQGADEGEDWAFCSKHSVAKGCLAAASFPKKLYTDSTQMKQLPDDQIQGAPIIENGQMGEILEKARQDCQVQHLSCVTLETIVERLRKAGHQVAQVSYLLGHQLPIGAEVGFSLRIGKDRWQLLRFPSKKEAGTEAANRGHCVQGDRFVFWSDPPPMYQAFLTHTKPDEEIPWSKCLEDEAFCTLIGEICT